MKDTSVDTVSATKFPIDWFRSAPWWRIASQSIVISWRSTHILLCAAGLLLTQLWVNATHYLFGPTELVTGKWLTPSSGYHDIPWTWGNGFPNLVDSPRAVWKQFLDPVMSWLTTPMSLNGTAYTMASMLGIMLIWSFIGGCLTRRSAVELGTQMTAPWAETFKLVVARWQSIAWSVSMPCGLILMIGLVPLVLGWISNIPGIGIWVSGALLVPFVICSIGIGWCAAITLFGFPLSITSIVSERQADAYDGISRSAAYTFQRPLTLGLCVLAAEVLSWIGGSMMGYVLRTGFAVIKAGFDIGSTSNLSTMSPFWSPIIDSIVPLLLAAFGFSFFWTASAGTYLILRRDVDHAEFDLIDMNVADEPKPLPKLPKQVEASDDAE
jgi:hypothetical protein